MNRLKRLFLQFAEDESGQAMTEYIILLAFCAVAASTLARKIMGVFDLGILKLGGQLEKDLKAGRSQLDTWSN